MSTNTTHGDIPFKLVHVGSLDFFAPVRVMASITDRKGRPEPLTDSAGHYIYALPGGRYLLHDNTVFDPRSSILG